MANPSTAAFELSPAPAGQPRPHPGIAGRSSSRRVLIGLLVALAAAVWVGIKYQQSQKTQPVVAVRDPVAPGQVLTAGDLTQTRLADNSTVPSVPAARLSQLVGKVAQSALLPGDVVDPAAVGSTAGLPAGELAMTLALAPEQAVGGSLHAGDVVDVFASTPPAGGQPGAGAQIVSDVTVRAVSAETTAGAAATELVTLELSAAQATTLEPAYRGTKVDLALVSGG